MRRLRYSARAIARELGRSHSTILRELRRNAEAVDKHADFHTQAEEAHQAAHQRRSKASRQKMRLKSKWIRDYVELHLKLARWSPEIIAGKLSSLGDKISAESIYQWINVERGDLKECLLIAGKSRRRRCSGKSHRRGKTIPHKEKRSIESLPQAAKERSERGHLEMDALCGKKGHSVIQNKTDRFSRKMWLDLSPTLESEPYAKLCTERLQNEKGEIKTILLDNGAEHQAFPSIDKELEVKTYFCHPYASSERGTVENRNKALRRFLPKGEVFDNFPREYLDWIEDYFNNMPMKVLSFRTPNEVWEKGL